MRSSYLTLLVLASFCCCVVDCSCRKKESKEEQVAQWLLRCPPVTDPCFWPPEAYTYSTHEEWANAGRKIEGIEETLICFYGNNTTSRPMWIIILALGLVGSDNSVPVLIQALEDESQPLNARNAAASLLGRIGNQAAVDPLCNIVRSTEHESLKYNAISALGRIGDPKARPVVENILKSEQHTQAERDFLLEVLEELKEK